MEGEGFLSGDGLDQTDHADDGQGENRSFFGLVVEADVSAGDGQVPVSAGVAHSLDGVDELPVDGGVVRVAKVKAVGDTEGFRAGAQEVASCFGDGDPCADVGVGVDVPGVAVEGEGECVLGLGHTDDGAICGEPDGSVAQLDHVVVLSGDGLAAAQVGVLGQEFGDFFEVVGQGDGLFLEGSDGMLVVGFAPGSSVDGCALSCHECGWRDFCYTGFSPEVSDCGSLGNFSDGCELCFPACKDFLDVVEVLFPDEDEHTFLGLGQEDFPGFHFFVSQGDVVQVDIHAEMAACGDFQCGAG